MATRKRQGGMQYAGNEGFVSAPDWFGSGMQRETSTDKIARVKSLGLSMELFAQQDVRRIPVSTDDFDCEACAVLGSRGQGKSNTVTRIIEQIHPKGLGMTIFDIEGEYYSLKSKYQMLVVGEGNNRFYDLQLSNVKPEVLAEIAINQSLTVVLDFSDVDETDRMDYCINYFSAVMSICNTLKNEGRPAQHLLVVEEVQEYAPEDGPIPFGDKQKERQVHLKKKLRQIATRGRKRGIGLIVASQRTAMVDKTLLSQCETKILHKVTLTNDINQYEKITCGQWDSQEFKDQLCAMVPGDCFCYFGDAWYTAHVLPQDCVHLGYSPKLSYAGDQIPDMQTIDQVVIDAILNCSSSASKKCMTPAQKIISDLQDELDKVTRQKDVLLENNRRMSGELSIATKLKVDPEALAKALIAAGVIPVQADPTTSTP